MSYQSISLQVANSETEILDKSSESINSLDKRKTSVNFKPFNTLEKASEKTNLPQNHEAVSEGP